MTYPVYGVPLSAVALSAQSRDLFDLDFRAVSVDADAGTITTPSGHVGTFARAATLASVQDATDAGSYTALDGQMAWELPDWDNDGTRESFGLKMGTADRLAFPSAMRAVAHCGLLEMIDTGIRTTASATVLSLRNDGATGAGLWLDTDGSTYRMNYYDGGTTRSATLGSGATASGDRLRFTWDLTSAGALTFALSINEATEIEATAAALTLPASWAASVSWRLNARGTSANPATGWYRRVRVVAGYVAPSALRERR